MALHGYLQVGLSFADLALFEKKTLKASRRFYLPQEPLGTALKKFWAEHGTPRKLHVCSRYLEKILDAKLGGTVAQVVTSGFETWPILRQPVLPNNRFDLKPYRQEPLASQELIFGLSERLNHEGQVIKPLDINELEFINSKLKLMGVKRVCVNLLFSHKNSAHETQVAKYFREQGFEVLAAPRESDSNDEMPAWRKNVINACLSGAFTEHVDDIKKSWGDADVELAFLNRQGHEFQEDKNHITGSLFSWTKVIAESLKDQAEQVLYLGLENWSLISTRHEMPHWQSPWGLIAGKIPKITHLDMQPTQEVSGGFWGGIQFTKNELGYEPGPMAFGRALKPTTFDVLNEKFKLSITQIQTNGAQKFRNQLTAMIKNIPELANNSVDGLIQDLVDHLVQMLAIECHFRAHGTCKRTVVTGLFAPHFYPLLKKKWQGSELVLDSQAENREVHSIFALKGGE
jgi:hypothetical protein